MTPSFLERFDAYDTYDYLDDIPDAQVWTEQIILIKMFTKQKKLF